MLRNFYESIKHTQNQVFVKLELELINFSGNRLLYCLLSNKRARSKAKLSQGRRKV